MCKVWVLIAASLFWLPSIQALSSEENVDLNRISYFSSEKFKGHSVDVYILNSGALRDSIDLDTGASFVPSYLRRSYFLRHSVLSLRDSKESMNTIAKAYLRLLEKNSLFRFLVAHRVSSLKATQSYFGLLPADNQMVRARLVDAIIQENIRGRQPHPWIDTITSPSKFLRSYFVIEFSNPKNLSLFPKAWTDPNGKTYFFGSLPQGKELESILLHEFLMLFVPPLAGLDHLKQRHLDKLREATCPISYAKSSLLLQQVTKHASVLILEGMLRGFFPKEVASYSKSEKHCLRVLSELEQRHVQHYPFISSRRGFAAGKDCSFQQELREIERLGLCRILIKPFVSYGAGNVGGPGGRAGGS